MSTPLKASLLSLKPYKNEASLRIRNSSAALVAAFLLTQLTPAPSLWTAVDVVFYESGEGKSAFWMFCAAGEWSCFLILQARLLMASRRASHTRSLHPERTSGSSGAFISTEISPTHPVTFEKHQVATVTKTS
jgi:hypothetical protein